MKPQTSQRAPSTAWGGKTAALCALCVLCGLTAFAGGCDTGEPPAPDDGGPRILSLAPNVTEILFAMGLGDRVVGRTSYCTWPPEARRLPIVGDTLSLDMEKVIALRPTHAFAITRRGTLVERLSARGMRAVALRSDTMAQLLASIRTIGRETGREPDAEALLARIEADLAAVRARVEGRPRPRTLFAFPMTIGSVQMMVAGRGTFVDELLGVAGAENAFPETADWPMVSPARVIELAPEVVIVHAADLDPVSDRAREIARAWDKWQSIPAVAAGRVHLLTEPMLTIPGPRVGLAARRLAETIHPDLAEDARP